MRERLAPQRPYYPPDVHDARRCAGHRTLGPRTAGSVGTRARAGGGRRHRTAARDHPRRGRGRSHRRRRGAALPGARGGRGGVRARRPALGEDEGVGRRRARRHLPVRRRGARALGLAVPADRYRARPGLPHRVDHEVLALDRVRRLRVQGPAAVLPAAVLLGARAPRPVDRHERVRSPQDGSARHRARRPPDRGALLGGDHARLGDRGRGGGRRPRVHRLVRAVRVAGGDRLRAVVPAVRAPGRPPARPLTRDDRRGDGHRCRARDDLLLPVLHRRARARRSARGAAGGGGARDRARGRSSLGAR